MARFLNRVPRADAANDLFEYLDEHVTTVPVPIAECEGTYPLSRGKLLRYFGVESETPSQLPEYIIVPHLHSSWKEDCPKGYWWDITGQVIAYTPIEWVPIVHLSDTIPFNVFEKEITVTSREMSSFELYLSADATFNVSMNTGWKGLRMDIGYANGIKANYKTSTEMESIIRAHEGKVAVKKIVMSMALRVKRVYQRAVRLHVNDLGMPGSLTWNTQGLTWAELRVPQSSLGLVKNLQYHPVFMTGAQKSSLYLQVLPVFDKQNDIWKLDDLCLVLSCKNWKDWYVYDYEGRTSTCKGIIETLPTPRNPLVTFVPVPDPTPPLSSRRETKVSEDRYITFQ
ncbi:hypothetical protein BG000_006322 [Podila horticola]|nr:hypothetical protein BG000_006322 [Podila horticola]